MTDEPRTDRPPRPAEVAPGRHDGLSSEHRPNLTERKCLGHDDNRLGRWRSLLSVHRLTKAAAARRTRCAQLLDAARPTDLVTMVRQLTCSRSTRPRRSRPAPTSSPWSRLGSTRQDITQGLEQDRTLFEHGAGATDERPRAAPRWPGRARSRAHRRLDPRQRPLPARHPGTLEGRPGIELARHSGHVRRAVGLDGVDQQPQRHPDARVLDDAR